MVLHTAMSEQTLDHTDCKLNIHKDYIEQRDQFIMLVVWRSTLLPLVAASGGPG